MTREPLVTIGLPVYNGEQYLEQALDGLVAQTLTDFELIISDNASTDRHGRDLPAVRRDVTRASATCANRPTSAPAPTTTSWCPWRGADTSSGPVTTTSTRPSCSRGASRPWRTTPTSCWRTSTTG